MATFKNIIHRTRAYQNKVITTRTSISLTIRITHTLAEEVYDSYPVNARKVVARVVPRPCVTAKRHLVSFRIEASVYASAQGTSAEFVLTLYRVN